MRQDGLKMRVRAFRQVNHVTMHGIKLEECVEEHEELKTALTKWGAGKTGFQLLGK